MTARQLELGKAPIVRQKQKGRQIMFVNITTKQEKSGEKSSIYQCEVIHIRPLGDSKVLFTLELPTKTLDIEVEKASSGVFIMNDAGKTIDRYIWKN